MEYIDKGTIEAFRDGQISGFEKIYRLFNGRVYNFVFSIIRDSSLAKDLTQDTFLLIWDRRANIDGANNLEGYIFTVAKNAVYQHIRRKLLLQKYINNSETNLEPENAGIEQKLDNKLFEEDVLKLINELPESRKKIFLLFWKSDMSYREIAELLSVSEKTVATQIHRSLQFLREKFGNKTLYIILLFLSENL